MANLIFNCGCKFEIRDKSITNDLYAENLHGKYPKVVLTINPNDPQSIQNFKLDCPAVWDLLCKGDTKGIFQLENDLGKTWALRTKPRSIDDFADLISLIRPGCLKSYSGEPPKSMTQRYADRKNGLEPVTHLHDAVAECLEKTQGILIFQEQSMKIAETVAGFNKQEADVLRKSIGKKKADLMAQVEKEFTSKAESLGKVTLKDAKEIFSWIRESQKYSFNKSHAVTYATDGYWAAVLKAHFPLTFYASWIKGAMWKADTDEEVSELVNDCKFHGIDVRIPQLYNITPTTTIINDEYIQFGAAELKGIGTAFTNIMNEKFVNCENIIGKARKEWSFLEFLIFASKEFGKTVTETFINIGVLDYMLDVKSRNNKKYCFEQLQKLSSTGTELEWLKQNYHKNKWKTLSDAFSALQPTKKNGGGTSTEKRSSVIKSLIYLLDNPTNSLEDTIDWIAVQEEYYLGTPLTVSRVDNCFDAVAANMSCKEFIEKQERMGRNELVILAVEVVSSDMMVTKSGKTPGAKMARLKIRDSSLMIPAVCFPKAYSECGHVLQEGNTLLLMGEKTKDGNFSVTKAKEI